MMCHDQFRPTADGLGRDIRCQRQTSDGSSHPGRPITQQQPDIVPVFRQMQRCELFQDVTDIANGRHQRSSLR